MAPAGDVADENLTRTQRMPVRAVSRRNDDPFTLSHHDVADARHVVTYV
jgi:hypothetical protein